MLWKYILHTHLKSNINMLVNTHIMLQLIQIYMDPNYDQDMTRV